MTPTAPAPHYRICPLCEACCGLEIRTEADKVLSILAIGSTMKPVTPESSDAMAGRPGQEVGHLPLD